MEIRWTLTELVATKDEKERHLLKTHPTARLHNGGCISRSFEVASALFIARCLYLRVGHYAYARV